MPHREYVRIRQLRRCIASSAVNRIVLAPDEFRQYVDVSVSVSVRHVFVQFNADLAMATFYYRAFNITVPTNLKLNALLSHHRLEYSVRNQTGRLRTGFEYFASIDRITELTAVPVFDRRYFEKVSITLNIYLYVSLYLLTDCLSIRSHSQTSITFVTVYGFLGNRLRTGLCNVYVSCFKSHDLILCLDFAFVAAESFCTVENLEGREGD